MSKPKIFTGILFHLSSSLPIKERNELKEILVKDGGAPALLQNATHIITNTDIFEGHQTASKAASIVTPLWVTRSLERQIMVPPKFYSADRTKLFSGVVACGVNLSPHEKELIGCGIAALGGQWRAGLTKDVTHLLANSYVDIVRDTAQKFPHINIVTPHWFDDSLRFFVLLPCELYAWPDPPMLCLPQESEEQVDSDELPEARLQLLRSAAAHNTDILERLQNGPPNIDIWNSRKILLSPNLGLEGGRRIAFESALSHSGATVLKYRTNGHNGSAAEEIRLVKKCDILITPFRNGEAFRWAVRKGKLVGSLSWLLYVQSTGIIAPPRDQLLHYPVPNEPVRELQGKSYTVTNYTGEAREYLKRLIEAMGGDFTPSLSKSTAVVIAAHQAGEKVAKAKAWSLPIVNHFWLEDSFANWMGMALTKQKYISFHPGIDFGKVLAENGFARVPDTVFETIPSSDQEEDFDQDIDMEPGPAPTSTTDSAREAAEVEDIMDYQPDNVRMIPPDAETEIVPTSSPGQKGLLSTPRTPHSKPKITYSSSSSRRRPTVQLQTSDSEEDGGPVLASSTTKSRRLMKRKTPGKDGEHPVPRSARSKRTSEVRSQDPSESEDEHQKSPSRHASAKKNKGRRVLSDEETEAQAAMKPSSRRSGRNQLTDSEEDDPTSTRQVEPEQEEEESPSPGRRSSRKSKGKRPSAPDPEQLSQSPTDEEMDIDPAASDSDLEPPDVLLTQQPRKRISSTKPIPKKQVYVELVKSSPRKAPERTGSMRIAGKEDLEAMRPSSPTKKFASTRRTSTTSGRVPMKSPSTIHNAASTPTTSSTTTPTPEPESHSANQRSRRNAAKAAESKLKDSMADANKFQKEIRSKNFNRHGSTPDDYVTPLDGPSSRQKRKTPPSESDDSEDEDSGSDSPAPTKRAKRLNDSATTGSKIKPLKAEKRAGSNKKPQGNILILASGFSGSSLKTLQSALQRFRAMTGAREVEGKPETCTHLIINNFARRAKVLCALQADPYVVTEQWIHDSVKAKEVLPEEDYFLKDRDAEKKYHFNLADSLAAARKRKASRAPLLFNKKHFCISDRAAQGIIDVLESSIRSYGGQCDIRKKDPPGRLNPHWIVIAHDEDMKRSNSGWAKLPQRLYTTGIVLDSVVRQTWLGDDRRVILREASSADDEEEDDE